MIDPIEFGEMKGELVALSRQVGAMDKDIKELLELANKGRGAFWLAMGVASLLGAISSWILGGHWK